MTYVKKIWHGHGWDAFVFNKIGTLYYSNNVVFWFLGWSWLQTSLIMGQLDRSRPRAKNNKRNNINNNILSIVIQSVFFFRKWQRNRYFVSKYGVAMAVVVAVGEAMTSLPWYYGRHRTLRIKAKVKVMRQEEVIWCLSDRFGEELIAVYVVGGGSVALVIIWV